MLKVLFENTLPIGNYENIKTNTTKPHQKFKSGKSYHGRFFLRKEEKNHSQVECTNNLATTLQIVPKISDNCKKVACAHWDESIDI